MTSGAASRPRRVAVVTLLAVAAATLVALTTQRGDARATEPQVPANDAEMVGRLLDAVRGAAPFYCELATRVADGRSWWSSSGENLVETDSASAALIRWVHNEHRDTRAVPRLAAGLRDEDRCVRRVAGALLGHVDDPSAVAVLIDGLGHANPGTRAAAAIGLGIGERAGAVRPLIALLRDPSADVRRSAAWALGAIEDDSALVPLIELLERDTDARVRQAAAWAIGEVSG